MRLNYQFDHIFSFSMRDTLDFGNHAQGEVEFGVILDGSCRFFCGNSQTVLHKGDVYVVFPNQLHRYEDSQQLKAYLLVVPVKRYLPAYYNTLMKQLPICPVLHSGQYDPAILTMMDTAFCDQQTASEAVMQGYLAVIFGKLLGCLQLQQRQPGTEEALRRILEYLNAHYRENMTRRDIAKAAGYNESYVSHLFSQSMGTTLPEYIHSLQVDDACYMLKTTDVPVAQIASELGFVSIRNFNRVFQNRTGMSPTQYRSSAKK